MKNGLKDQSKLQSKMMIGIGKAGALLLRSFN